MGKKERNSTQFTAREGDSESVGARGAPKNAITTFLLLQ